MTTNKTEHQSHRTPLIINLAPRLMALATIIVLGIPIAADAAQRPISDFVNRQGTYCLQTDPQGNTMVFSAAFWARPRAARSMKSR